MRRAKSIGGKSVPPFFFVEKREKDERYTAWSGDLGQIKKLYDCLINQFPEDIEILFKIQREGKERLWEKYFCKNTLSHLKESIKTKEGWFFSDGAIQISIKRIDTGEYLTFDEHGILFLYSVLSKDYSDFFKENGFEERREELVFESGHWHISPENSEKFRVDFLHELHFKKV